MPFKPCATLALWGLLASALHAGPKKAPPSPEELNIQAQMAEKEQAIAELKKNLIAVRKAQQEKIKAGPVDVFKTQLHVPRLPNAPTIDGNMEEGEWKFACGMATGAGIREPGLRERPSAMMYFGWDPDYFYVSQKLPIRKGEKLKRLHREPKHDNVYAGETSWEFYVDRDSFGSHPSKCRWQFMANAVGNKWDMEHQYQIGQKYYDWDGEWDMKQAISPDGKFWVVEAAIPRTTVYQKEPIHAGQRWKIGFATNLHNPWTWSGFYGYNIPATFTESTPVIHFDKPEKTLIHRGIGFDMTLHNTTKVEQELEVVATIRTRQHKKPQEVVHQMKWPYSLKPDQREILNVAEHLGDDIVKDATKYDLTVMVLNAEKQSVFTWNRYFQYSVENNKIGLEFVPDPNPFIASVKYAPLSNYLRLKVDVYDFARKDELAKVLVRVNDPKGQEICQHEIKNFHYGLSEELVDIPELKAGTYRYSFDLLNASGEILSQMQDDFEVQDLSKHPWIGNTIGEEDVVPKMFEALQHQGSTIQAFKKSITSDGTALPTHIKVQGRDVLSGPIQLIAKKDGQNLNLEQASDRPKLKSRSDATIVLNGQSQSPQLKVNTEVKWQYDSTAKVTLNIEPQGPQELDELKLVIPFNAETSRNFMVVGLNMRLSSHGGAIPKGKGTVWSSKEVPHQKMTLGNFIPVLWVGDREKGLTWFADSDEGWWPNDKEAAIELVRRKDGGVNMEINFAAAKVNLTQARKIVFGLNVNPVRSMSEHRSSPVTFGFIDKRGTWVKGMGKRREFALRYPQDPSLAKKVADAYTKYGQIYSPYTEMSNMDIDEHSVDYFKEEWEGITFSMSPNENCNDYLLHYSKKFMNEVGGKGYYFDNIFPRITKNYKSGTAYLLPDGRIQPGYCMWAFRSHFQRMRVLMDQSTVRGRLCIHNTRFQFAPVMAFADLAMGGEMATPKMGSPDFMDMYPKEMIEVYYNANLWGYKLSHLYHYKWQTYVDELGEIDMEAATKGHRTAQATMLAHGVEFFHGINYNKSLMYKYQLIKGLCDKEMEFIPHWDRQNLIQLRGSEKDQAAAVFRGNKAIIVIMSNYSHHDRYQIVDLDLPELLAMPKADEQRIVSDLERLGETGGQYQLLTPLPEKGIVRLDNKRTRSMIKNALRAKVAARDFRIFVIANAGMGKGAGF